MAVTYLVREYRDGRPWRTWWPRKRRGARILRELFKDPVWIEEHERSRPEHA